MKTTEKGKWVDSGRGVSHFVKTPDFIHNPSYPCSCTIAVDGSAMSISYCAMHKATPELLEALRDAVQSLRYYGGENPRHDGLKRMEAKALAAISKATGGGL